MTLPLAPRPSTTKTPWFSGTDKPARVGYYEVCNYSRLGHRSKFFLTGNRRFWNGSSWRGGWFNERVSIFGTHPGHKWRGFMEAQG